MALIYQVDFVDGWFMKTFTNTKTSCLHKMGAYTSTPRSATPTNSEFSKKPSWTLLVLINHIATRMGVDLVPNCLQCVHFPYLYLMTIQLCCSVLICIVCKYGWNTSINIALQGILGQHYFNTFPSSNTNSWKGNLYFVYCKF